MQLIRTITVNGREYPVYKLDKKPRKIIKLIPREFNKYDVPSILAVKNLNETNSQK